MSKSAHKERTEAQTTRNHKTLQTNTAHTTDQINSTLNNLRDRIIPSQPYLLSVPSDIPYRHSSHFINTWYLGTPFSAEEEQLQYLSFLSHQGEEDSLLKVVGGWADQRGDWIEEDTASPASLSGHTTPIEQPSRKKISLKDYQTKDKTQPSTPTTKGPSQELRKQVMKTEAKEHSVRAEEGSRVADIKDGHKVKQASRDNSRVGRSQVDGARSPQRAVEPHPHEYHSPRKRRRLSSESPKREIPKAKSEREPDPEESKDLPLLLSPTLPAQRKDRSRKALPGLLLPDLPPGLEKLVAKADSKLKADSTLGTRTESVKSILNNALGGTAGKRPPEKALNDVNTNRVRSDSQASLKTASNTPKVQSPAVKPLSKPITRPVTPLQNGISASPKPRQRHTIALKYGKKNRKRVEALLKFAPRPKKLKPLVEETTNKPSEQRAISTKTLPDADKAERKRPADVSPERPVKKLKQLETPEKPKVNNLAATKSPIPTVSISKPRIDIATPKKELKSSAMRRIESQDGEDVRTPQGDRGRTSTPVNAATSSQAKASPGASSSISKEDRAGWQEINSKFFALGRTLKHEGTSLGPSPGNERSGKDQALSVVLLIEALLCFMINHAAQSQARPRVDPGWSTIIPYHIFVFKASRKYPHLHGLVIQLGAVCRQAIHNFDIDRLARDPLPFDHFESAPTPGSDGNTRQNEDVERSKKRYVHFRDQLVLNARELHSAWLEGSRYLSPTLIEQEYPKTWARRTKNTSRRGLEKLKPDAINQDYYLPLDVSSNAFEATRFSVSFLKEWSDKEKINWKPRIEL